jgi:hypothetical protein
MQQLDRLLFVGWCGVWLSKMQKREPVINTEFTVTRRPRNFVGLSSAMKRGAMQAASPTPMPGQSLWLVSPATQQKVLTDEEPSADHGSDCVACSLADRTTNKNNLSQRVKP